MVVHIISVGLTAFYFYLANPGTDLFSWYVVVYKSYLLLLWPETHLTDANKMAILIIYKCYEINFRHPVCMSVAFALLLLQAIVIFSPESSLTPNSPRPVKANLRLQTHKLYQQSTFSRIKFNYIGYCMHLELHLPHLDFLQYISTRKSTVENTLQPGTRKFSHCLTYCMHKLIFM